MRWCLIERLCNLSTPFLQDVIRQSEGGRNSAANGGFLFADMSSLRVLCRKSWSE